MRIKKHAGQAIIEYGLIVVLVAILLIIVLQIMGVSLQSIFCRVAGGLGVKNCATLCQDDFNDQASEKVRNGTWTLTNGQLCNFNGGIVYNKCSMASNMTATDYTVTLQGAMLSAGNGYGIFFRTTDPGPGANGYAFQYDPGFRGFVIRKWVNGSEINPPLAFQQVTGFDWYGRPHDLSVKVVGNTFTGFLDGQPVITGTDPDNSYPSGGAGIRTWYSSNLCVDQFRITP